MHRIGGKLNEYYIDPKLRNKLDFIARLSFQRSPLREVSHDRQDEGEGEREKQKEEKATRGKTRYSACFLLISSRFVRIGTERSVKGRQGRHDGGMRIKRGEDPSDLA